MGKNLHRRWKPCNCDVTVASQLLKPGKILSKFAAVSYSASSQPVTEIFKAKWIIVRVFSAVGLVSFESPSWSFSALAWILFVWAGRVTLLAFRPKKRSRTRRSFNSFISRARRGKRRVREGEWVWAQMSQHSLRLRRPESAEDLRQQLKPRTKQFWMNVSSSPIRHFWEEKTFWGLQKKFWSKLCVKDFSLDDDDDGVNVDDELSIFWRDLLLRKFCCKNYSPRTGPEIFV